MTGQARQKVRPAAQLLSGSFGHVMELLRPEWVEERKFIHLSNDSFDVCNATCPTDKKPLSRGLGRDVRHLELLGRFEDEISAARFGRRRDVLPFQLGYQVSLRSVRGLLEDVKRDLGPGTYLLTARLNQDPLESFFSLVRGKGGASLNPSPTEAKCRLKNLTIQFLVRAGINPLSGKSGEARPFPDDDVETGFVSDRVEEVGVEEDLEELLHEVSQTSASSSSGAVDPVTGVTTGQYAMTHCAGYVAAKVRSVDPSLGTPSTYAGEDVPIQTLYTRLKSYGGLTIPNEIWLQKYQKMEQAFSIHHHREPDQLSRRPRVIGEVVNLLEGQRLGLDGRVIKRFTRLRTFIRMGRINRERRLAAIARRNRLKVAQFLR